MQIPLVMTFKGIARVEAMKALIQELSAKVERYCDHVTSCRVAVERDPSSQRDGHPYRVRIDLTVPPGHELVVRRESSEGEGLQPLGSVVREAFSAAARQLKALSARQRLDVKNHTSLTVPGVVTRIFHERGYGFVRGIDGREAFFHRTSVSSKNFEEMVVGSSVRFVEDEGPDGYVAHSVRVLEREHIALPEEFAPEGSIPLDLLPQFQNEEFVTTPHDRAPPAKPREDERARVTRMGRERR